MNERDTLLASIADTIEDYRAGEIVQPTPDHVDQWVCQFDKTVQVPLLREMDYVLKRTYFSNSDVSRFFAKLVENNELASDKPHDFWHNATILDIQHQGHSQTEIRKLFGEVLNGKYGLKIDQCGSIDGAFIYLDDALFTGGRIGTDLSNWIEKNSPEKATLHIVVIASHRFGKWKCEDRLRKVAIKAEKDIDLCFWAAIRFENRKHYRYKSEVLWPSVLPDDDEVQSYVQGETKFPFEPRQPGGRLKNDIFSSENGRQLLERELLLAGVRIRSFCANPSLAMRPLGFGPFGLGFGSMIATFRNCPNNCPLALWWGDPNAPSHHPFSRWYPLLPRKTYSDDSSFDDINFWHSP